VFQRQRPPGWVSATVACGRTGARAHPPKCSKARSCASRNAPAAHSDTRVVGAPAKAQRQHEHMQFGRLLAQRHAHLAPVDLRLLPGAVSKRSCVTSARCRSSRSGATNRLTAS